MALPNIRLNVSVPFPARTQGSGVVKLSKANGVWTVGLDYTQVANYIPPPAQFAATYFLIWNSVVSGFSTITLTQIQSLAVIQPIVPTLISSANSPYAVLATDTVLYVDTSGGAVVIDLQAQAARAGIALTIKDVTGNAFTNNISIVCSGSEKLDSFATYPINEDFGGVRLNPLAGGYTVAP